MSKTVFAAKCKNCQKISYPTHFYCPGCGHKKFESVDIEGEGTLLTYTRVYNLAVDYLARYIGFGIVELDMGIRALGQLDIEDPQIGMRVKATVGTV